MFYQEYTPSSLLSLIVDKYWVSTEFGQDHHQQIIPEICTSIVFRLNGFSGTANLVGISTQPSAFIPQKEDYYLGIRFHPGALGQITHEDFSQLTNSYTSLDNIIPLFDAVFLEQLYECGSLDKRIYFIEKVLKQLITAYKDLSITTTLVAQLLQQNHTLTTHYLADQYDFSTRQLQRKFKKEVGISIKMFSRLVRFNKTYTRLLTTSENLQDISFNLGFYDPAHLINEIKVFSGRPPSFFR